MSVRFDRAALELRTRVSGKQEKQGDGAFVEIHFQHPSPSAVEFSTPAVVWSDSLSSFGSLFNRSFRLVRNSPSHSLFDFFAEEGRGRPERRDPPSRNLRRADTLGFLAGSYRCILEIKRADEGLAGRGQSSRFN